MICSDNLYDIIRNEYGTSVAILQDIKDKKNTVELLCGLHSHIRRLEVRGNYRELIISLKLTDRLYCQGDPLIRQTLEALFSQEHSQAADNAGYFEDLLPFLRYQQETDRKSKSGSPASE